MKTVEYTELKVDSLLSELRANKELIKMTEGKEDGSDGGSDSEPSEDNLDADEIEKIMPMKKKKKEGSVKGGKGRFILDRSKKKK